MSTRSGAPYTPRTARRVRARQLESSRDRARNHLRSSSVPPRPNPRIPRTATDTPPVILGPVMSNAPGPTHSNGTPSPQVLPAADPPISVSQPPIPGVLHGQVVPAATRTVEAESINTRLIRSICISENEAHNREINNKMNSLEQDIRALTTRTDQLDTVIADIQSLRRDVNSLFERSRPPVVADPRAHHGSQSARDADPSKGTGIPDQTIGTQGIAPVAARSAMGQELPTAPEQDSGSFSKISELVARLERLERAKREKRDHQDRDRRSPRRTTRRDRRHRRKDSDSDSSSADSARRSGRNSGQSSSDEDRRHKPRRTPRKGDTFRPKGERYYHLKPLVATDAKFKEVLDYRYYRLRRTSSSRDLGKIRHQVKHMMVTLRRHIFDGREPILILDFLRRYANECDAQGMSEAHAHCALEYFLEETASDHYIAVNNSSTADEGGVTSWPEAVHYLLRSYATHDAIREATLKLTSIRQGTGETEEEYSARLNNAAIRCGNVHSMDEKKTIFVDGLQTAIKALVSRYREDHLRATYLELVQFASVEGKTHRARSGVTPTYKQMDHPAKVHTPKSKGSSANPLLTRKSALYAEPWDVTDDIPDRQTRVGYGDPLNLIGESPAAFRADIFSDETSEVSNTLPTETSHSEADPALYLTPRSHYSQASAPNMVRPQRLSFEGALQRDRPGWETPRNQPRPPPPLPGQARIICHSCYIRNDHIAPACGLPLKDMWQIVRNYSSLTPDEKSRVPPTSFYRARAQFGEDGRLVFGEAKAADRQSPRPVRQSDERHPAILPRSKSPSRSGN